MSIILENKSVMKIKLESGNYLEYQFPKGADFNRVVDTLIEQRDILNEPLRFSNDTEA